MMILSSRERTFAVVSIVLGFLYLNLVFIVDPIKRVETRVNAEILRSSIRLGKSRELLNSGPRLQESYAAFVAPLLRTADSDEKESSQLLSHVGSIANDNGLRIASIKPVKTEKGAFWDSFYIDVTVNGSMDGILHFISTLQQAPSYFKVNTLNLERGTSDSVVQLSIVRNFVK